MSTKNQILELMENKRGETLSGEQLAGLLHVSRNAVWKAVQELRRDGYRILAVTRKGYCLSDENDILSVQGLLPFLSQNSWADKIHVYQSLESTSETAKGMAIAGAEHGTVVISDCQTSGRGRYSREFFSPHGSGLYMSIILRPPHVLFEHTAAVTAFAAVSVCEAIEIVSEKKPGIKWVNDIFIDGKKVCGILTEAVTDFESGSAQWIVLGIGINVNTREESFPDSLKAKAGSIFPGENMPNMRNRLAADLINRILTLHGILDEANIFARYKSRLLVLGSEVTVVGNTKKYKAVAIDIDDAGRLLVKNESGEIAALSYGEIQMQI